MILSKRFQAQGISWGRHILDLLNKQKMYSVAATEKALINAMIRKEISGVWKWHRRVS